MAILAGYVTMLVVLYRDPARGLENATAGIQSLLYFVVFPFLGLVSGGYALGRRQYSGAFVFLAGSYLGVFGLALALGGVAPLSFALLGAFLFAVGAGSIVVSVKDFVAFLGFDIDL